MTVDSLDRMRTANPLPDEAVSSVAPDQLARTPFVTLTDFENKTPVVVRHRRKRLMSVLAVAAVLTASGGVAGVAAASSDAGRSFLSVFTGTTAAMPDARELPVPEPELNMASPEFPVLVDSWTRNPNLRNVSLPALPRGSQGVSIPPGMTHRDVFGKLYRRLFASETPDSTITTVALSAAIDREIVQAWYRYWLRADLRGRHEVQGILDSFQDWPDLWRANPSHYDMPGSGEMVAIARVAEAARHNDSAPMAAWLRAHNPVPEANDPYLDVHSAKWQKWITADVASIPLPPGSARRDVFAVIYGELPVPPEATANFWTDDKGPRYAGSGLTWEQDSETGQLLGVQRSSVRSQAEEIAVHAWYAYWLSATPEQRRSAQPILDSMEEWQPLARALDRSGDKHIGQVAAIADAARKGEGDLMRAWVREGMARGR